MLVNEDGIIPAEIKKKIGRAEESFWPFDNFRPDTILKISVLYDEGINIDVYH